MDEMLDIFHDDAFSAVSLTDAVTTIPNSYGLINDLGIFRDEPIATRTAVIALQNGILNILPTRQLGAPPTFGNSPKAKYKSFVVPHIPHNDAVLADDVRGRFALIPGQGPRQLMTAIDLVNDKLDEIRAKHAITLENLRMGALKGQLLDADGSLIYDFFAEFGITQKVFDFKLGDPATNVGAICTAVSRYMQLNLLGDTMTSVKALCSPTFMDRLTSHPSVVNAYNFYMGTNPNRDDVRQNFPFKGIQFEEYIGYGTHLNEDSTTTQVPFIPDGDVRFFPLGTRSTFSNYWGPPNYIYSLNEAPPLGAEVFVAPLEFMKFGAGIEMHTESNPLPVVKRPQLLARGYSST